jgi:hypothetical protein
LTILVTLVVVTEEEEVVVVGKEEEGNMDCLVGPGLGCRVVLGRDEEGMWRDVCTWTGG